MKRSTRFVLLPIAALLIGTASLGVPVGFVAYGNTAAPSSPVVSPPPAMDVSDLSNQSQQNIAMAQMLFKLGQLQGQLATLTQQKTSQAAEVARLTTELKTVQDHAADLSKPRCDGVAYLKHSAAPAPIKK